MRTVYLNDIFGPDKQAERQKSIHPALLQNHELITNNSKPNKHFFKNYCQLLHITTDLAILHTLAFCLLQFEQLDTGFQESILHNLPS